MHLTIINIVKVEVPTNISLQVKIVSSFNVLQKFLVLLYLLKVMTSELLELIITCSI